MKLIKKAVKKVFQLVSSVYFGLPLVFIRIVNRCRHNHLKNWAGIARNFAKFFSKFSPYYCMIEFLPKNAEDVKECTLLTDTRDHEYAIVIQGPVLSGFTAESIRVYRKIFPKAYIIVSTWMDTNEKLAAELRGLADEVILSELPETSGLFNINYQAKSSYVGIKRACELGIPYSFRLRSDLRIYTLLAFEYLKTLLEVFPVDESVLHLQKKRIITPSRGG